MPRRTWLDSKIDVFLEELAASGMHLDRQRAGELITGQVRAVATLRRVTGATARSYLGDEIIKDMARRMLFEVAADLAANGGKLPDGIPETARSQLAATLRRDADGLIAITTTE